MVGERGFEPPTPWSRNSSTNAISLSRLGRLYVVQYRFTGFSAAIGPKLDPSFKSEYSRLWHAAFAPRDAGSSFSRFGIRRVCVTRRIRFHERLGHGTKQPQEEASIAQSQADLYKHLPLDRD
jgi:hypothetical protein